MEVEDFFPKYPNINNDETAPSYLRPYNGLSFEQVLYNKKEFKDLKVSKEDEYEQDDEDPLFKHQKVISRFLSAYTPYDALLLFHEMGTGKTCAAFGVVENLRKTDNRFDGAVIVTKNDSILNSLIEQLAKVCTNKKSRKRQEGDEEIAHAIYLPEINIAKVDSKKLLSEIRKIIKEKTNSFYDFHTLETFSGILEKKSDEAIIRDYSNKIIVIDEVHNVKLYGKGLNKQSNTYNQIYRLLHLPKNCKKIVMSGTPMTDKSSEIADIISLVLPEEKRFPVAEDFETEYLVTDENNIKKLRLDKVKEFKDRIRGYVSYLKASLSDVSTQYVGKVVKPLVHFRVVENLMSEHQKNAYQIAFKSYEKERGDASEKKHDVYKSVEQASLFVFPDSTYGKTGYETYIGDSQKSKDTSKFRFQLAPEFRGKTNEEKLELLRSYSSTYAKTIQCIIENPNHNTLVFNSSVHGSGVILFTKLLEMFGFSESIGIENTQAKRYALITSDKKENLTQIKNLFNDPKNRNGNYLQVIVFSATIAEGVSFFNVQEIHIQTPHWNYSQTSQVIARGLRLNSHKDLLQDGQKPVVKIYQHCAIADAQEPLKSIDMYKYSTSEIKDVSAKFIEHYIKEAAVDCQIFYDRNVIKNPALDGSRVCDYMKCEYDCEGITSINNLNSIDVSTYQLYYINNKMNPIISRVLVKFRQKFSLSLEELQRDEILSQYTTFELLFAMRKIISENIVIKNAYGLNCFLREYNNVFFLSNDLGTGIDFLCFSYTRYPIGKRDITLKDAIDTEIIRNVLIAKLKESQSLEDIDNVFPVLPQSTKKEIIIKVLQNQQLQDNFLQLLLTYFREKGIVRSPIAFTLDDKVYTWSLEENEWKEQKVEKKYVLPPITLQGFAGLEDPDNRGPDDQTFKIQNVTKTIEAQQRGETKRQYPGIACKSQNNPPRSYLLIQIGAEIPPEGKDNLNEVYKTIAKKPTDYLQFPTEKQKLLHYLKSNYGEKSTQYYTEKDDIETIKKALVFIKMPIKKQCELLYNTFKKHNALYDDPNAGQGYGKSKKSMIKGGAGASELEE